MIRDSSLLFLAMIAGRGSIVVCGALVANFFGAAAFALFTFVHMTASSVANIAMLGMMKGLVRFAARMKVDPSVEAFSRALLGTGVVSFGLMVAVVITTLLPTAFIGLPEQNAKPVFLALIFSIGVNNALTNLANGFEDFLRIAAATFAMGLILILGVFLAFWLDLPSLSLFGYLVATIVSSVVLAIIVIRVFLQRLASQRPVFDLGSFRAIGDYVGPMLLVSFMTNTGIWLAGRALLAGESGTQAFAEFSVGLQWFGLAQVASTVACGVALPVFTRNAFENRLSAQKATLLSGVILAMLGAFLVLLLVVFGHPIILGFYGAELSSAFWPLFLMVLAGIFAAPISLLGSLLIARERYFGYLLSTIIWWTVIVIGIVIAPTVDAVSISGLVVLSYVAFLGASFWFVFLESGKMK